MCTVTYLPTKKGYILTSNRDENRERSSSVFETIEIGTASITYPKDKGAGGTWIAYSNDDRLICLLNGAFEKHKHLPPYPMSRGKMVLDYFNYKSPEDFKNNFNFEGMEPFTLVIIHKGELYQLKRDEAKTYFEKLDRKKPVLWASATLYNTEWQEKRQLWFKEWQEVFHSFQQNDIINFHYQAGEGDIEHDLVMNRNHKVETVSITSIQKTKNKINLKFWNLLDDSKISKQLNINHENLVG